MENNGWPTFVRALSHSLCIVSAVFRDLQAAGVYPITQGKSPTFIPPPSSGPQAYGYSPSVVYTPSSSGVMMTPTLSVTGTSTPGLGGISTPINIPNTSEGWWPYVVGVWSSSLRSRSLRSFPIRRSIRVWLIKPLEKIICEICWSIRRRPIRSWRTISASSICCDSPRRTIRSRNSKRSRAMCAEGSVCDVVREDIGGGRDHSEGKLGAEAQHRDDADVYQQSYEGMRGRSVRTRCINRAN